MRSPSWDWGRPPGASRPPTTRCRPGTTELPKSAIVEFVEAVTTEGGRRLRGAGRPHRHLRQRRHAVGRAALLHPARVCARPDQDAGARASGMARAAAVQGGARERSRGARGERHRRPDAARHGEPRRHDHGRIRDHRRGLDRVERASEVRAPLHRARLPADARAAGLSAGQRLQDLHRVRRRRRVHAAVDRAGLRYPARAGDRLHHRHRVRAAGRRAGPDTRSPRSTSSTTRKASRSRSTSSSAAGRSRHSATPTATCRCCNGPRKPTAGAWG